jgi:hypothetical protein
MRERAFREPLAVREPLGLGFGFGFGFGLGLGLGSGLHTLAHLVALPVAVRVELVHVRAPQLRVAVAEPVRDLRRTESR